jgi:hypothetical protein
MELTQDVINALSTKKGLISNPIETGTDGTQKVCLERDEVDDHYCQALLVVKNGKVSCHTGLYRNRAIVNDGEVTVDTLEHAVEHAVLRFDSFRSAISNQVKEQTSASMKMIYSVEVQREIDEAIVRLNLINLGEDDLIRQLIKAQQHDPSTGFYVDCAAACAIGDERKRREMLKRRLAQSRF